MFKTNVIINMLLQKETCMINAFTYMFNDNKFFQKALFYFIFSFATQFSLESAKVLYARNIFTTAILLYVVGIIFSIIVNGYFISCVKALISQNKNYVLPLFNIKMLLPGVKYTLAFFLAVLCLSFVFLLVFILSIFIGKILSSLIIIIFVLLLAAYFNALAFIFANTEAFTSFLQFEKATNLIKNNMGKYCKGLIIMIIVFVITEVINYILSAVFKNTGMFIKILIPTIFTTYTIFIISFVIAKSISSEYADELRNSCLKF